MQRVVTILLLLILLLSGHHPQIRIARRPETMTLVATPVPLDAGNPTRRQLGELRYLGGWSLAANLPSFGGISSMRVSDNGDVVALSDGGEVITFSAGQAGVAGQAHSRARLRILPILPAETGGPRNRWDTESMAWDPASGKNWVGFEGKNRICRYALSFARVERCRAPDAIRGWPEKTGMESLVRLSDGRFIAIAEEAPGPDGAGHDMLLFAGDPVEAATAPPIRLSYRAPQGYLPTDALAIGRDRLVVLNRRITLADGFTGVVTLLDISDLRAGQVLAGRVVASLSAPAPHDNFEALAMSREGGVPVLWIASDDNHLAFQRTLLLKFAMPFGWFRADGVSARVNGAPRNYAISGMDRNGFASRMGAMPR